MYLLKTEILQQQYKTEYCQMFQTTKNLNKIKQIKKLNY